MTNEEAIKFFEGCKYHCDNEEPINIAISAIEKQIPKIPKNVYIAEDKGIITYWECPHCGWKHRSNCFECATSCCTHCGQKICWGEDEDDNT